MGSGNSFIVRQCTVGEIRFNELVDWSLQIMTEVAEKYS